MAESVKVDLEENSPYRVALELAHKIAQIEGKLNSNCDRKYWLDLYHQCRQVVLHNRDADFAMTGKG
jgi:hypothetical protein